MNARLPDDGLGPVRGVLLGVLLGIVLWALIGLAVRGAAMG